MDGQYGCIVSLQFARMRGDGPKARELVAQSGALRTLVGLGDRRVADMAVARADAVDAAPSGSMDRSLRDDVMLEPSVVRDVDFYPHLRKRKADVELAKIDADEKTFMEECRARREDALAKIMDAQARKITAEAAKESAQHALEEGRRLRRLGEAEMQRQAHLLEARQMTQMQVDVDAGVISAEAAQRLHPKRVAVHLEKYVNTSFEADLLAFKGRLAATKKSMAGIASDLGKRAKAGLLNKTRFLGKPCGDSSGGYVTWYEEDCGDLFLILKEIVEAWTALPSGQTTLRLG